VRIKCKRKDGGQHVGFVGKDYSKKGKRGFGLCERNEQALEVDFENSVSPFDMRLTNDRDSFHFLGFSGNNLGSDNDAVLTGTHKTEIRDGPRNVGNANGGHSANSESQVWYYSRDGRNFRAKWKNSGGNELDTTTCYDPEDDQFHLVADLGRFLRRHPQAYEVELELDE